MLECANCSWVIDVEKSDSRLPPWCPHCGADLKTRSAARPLALDKPPKQLEWEKRWAAPTFPRGRGKPVAPAFVEDGITTGPEQERPPAPRSSVLRPVLSRDEVRARPLPVSAPPGKNVAVLGLAAIFLTVAGALSYVSIEKSIAYRQAEGKFVQLVPARKGGSRPEVAYHAGGVNYKVVGGSSGLVPGPARVGDSAVVLYSVNDPGGGTVKSFSNLWLGPILTGLLGTGCLFVWCLRVPRQKAS